MFLLNLRNLLCSLFLAVFFAACSNSECYQCAVDLEVSEKSQGETDLIKDVDSNSTISSKEDSDNVEEESLPVRENLPFDDSEYPYVGLPRIVINTESYKEIEDRENYVNAKFQIFEKK